MTQAEARRPLNGTKTHPLKPGTIKVLGWLERWPMPSQELNPGVRDRLERGGYAEAVQLPSPYKKDKGALTTHYRITDAGRAGLKGGKHET